MRIYSVSYMATKNDNGHCLSFWSREEAEACRVELIEAGYYHVSAIS
jgi:hypothetical protein